MLPSQIGQPKSRRSHMYRRRGSRRRRILVVLIALLAITVTVWWVRGSSDAGTSKAEAVASTASDEDATDVLLDAPQSKSQASGRPQQPQQGPRSDDGRGDRDGSRLITMGRPASSPAPTQSPPPQRESSPSEREPEPIAQPPATEPERAEPDRRSTEQPPPEPHRSETANSAERRRAMQRMEAGMELLRANQPVEARRVLTHALESAGMDERNAQRIRETLTELNERLVFSPEIVTNDPFTYGYTVRPGDSLARIRSREGLAIDWRLIQRINRISRPERIQAGQNLKLVSGPFHAIVHKSEYRMDIYLGDGSERVYVRSFPVGLGEYNSTPVGLFRVTPNSKLIDPAWTNPRTGEQFASGDPMNPIGTRWIGMEGVSEAIRGLTGYGVHGTIDPDSIGRQESMGCIRLHTGDIELVYELLVEKISTVQIVE